jgi:hypothetical protein
MLGRVTIRQIRHSSDLSHSPDRKDRWMVSLHETSIIARVFLEFAARSVDDVVQIDGVE